MSSTFRRKSNVTSLGSIPQVTNTEQTGSSPLDILQSEVSCLANLPSTEPHNLPLAVTVQRKGTKAWAGGTTLLSTGLYDFDLILGGGQVCVICLFRVDA